MESVSRSPLGLLKASPTVIQYQMLWELIFLVQGFWVGEFEVGFELLTPLGVLLQL